MYILILEEMRLTNNDLTTQLSDISYPNHWKYFHSNRNRWEVDFMESVHHIVRTLNISAASSHILNELHV